MVWNDSVREHEVLYLEQDFDYSPPGDEPTLDLYTYITRLFQGNWYDDNESYLTLKQ